jgi:predicted phage terminase large subunit-like protein
MNKQAERTVRQIRPQPGPQHQFLSTSADIAIYGGSAGGGKSYALLLEPLRHVSNSKFSAVIFRRTLADVKKTGSLWDTSFELYGSVGAKPISSTLTWEFKSGSKITFGHLENENTVLNWQGAQIPLVAFDELTHFSRAQFFYMLSRNRSGSGVRPYVRATTNPDSDSWVAEFISWWIDQKTGLPILERSGAIRWFVRVGDVLQWADTQAELIERFGSEVVPKSVTFIPARLEDNAILMQMDPGYRANLLALPRVERERLLGGNWKVRPSSGLYFRREWVEIVDAIPLGTEFVRGWDFASTEKTSENDPDWTAGTKIGRMPDGRFIVAHHTRMQESPLKVERAVMNTASADGKKVRIRIPQDPGQAGKDQCARYVRMLAGYIVRTGPVSGDKATRFSPFSAQAEAGNVVVLRGDWNEAWFTVLENFPDAVHDDDVDSTSEAFNELTTRAQMTISDTAVRSAAMGRR